MWDKYEGRLSICFHSFLSSRHPCIFVWTFFALASRTSTPPYIPSSSSSHPRTAYSIPVSHCVLSLSLVASSSRSLSASHSHCPSLALPRLSLTLWYTYTLSLSCFSFAIFRYISFLSRRKEKITHFFGPLSSLILLALVHSLLNAQLCSREGKRVGNLIKRLRGRENGVIIWRRKWA